MSSSQMGADVASAWGLLPTGWPLVRFVDAPTPDAAVLFDCVRDDDQGDPFMWVSGFNPGVAQMVGNAEAHDVDYTVRTVTFKQIIDGMLAEALQAQSELARMVLQRRAWVMWQASADTEPLWFHTYGSQPSQVDMSEVALDENDPRDLWQIDLTLTADAWAEGARITQPTVRVSSNPSKLAGCRVELDDIVGDAPAPLRVETTQKRPDLTGNLFRQRALVGVSTPASRAGAVEGPVLLHVNEVFGGTSAVVENDARYAWGSGVAWSASGSTPVEIHARTAAVKLPAGAYRMLLRVHRFGAATGTIGGEFGGGDLENLWTLWRSTTGSGSADACVWVDLGPRQLGTRLPDDVRAAANRVSTRVVVTGAIAAAGGRIACDAVMLIPVPDGDTDGDWTALATRYETAVGQGETQVWDGADELGWAVQDDVVRSSTATPEGVAPMVVPGVDNTLVLLHHTSTDQAGFDSRYRDRLDIATEVTVSYQPRWLWLGDGGADR